MKFTYPLVAALAAASAWSIPGGAEPRHELAASNPSGSHDAPLTDRLARLVKRYMKKPSEITDRPEFGPPSKEERPPTAQRGGGWDRLDPDHQRYIEDYLDNAPHIDQMRMHPKWLKEDEAAKPGQTAMSQDKDGHFHIWYGSNDDDGRMKFHAMSKAYSMAANGIKDGSKGLTLHYDSASDPSRADVLHRTPNLHRDGMTAPAKDEAPMNLLQREGFHVTVVLAPAGESNQEAGLTSSLRTAVVNQQEKWNKEFDDAVQKAKDEKRTPPKESEKKRVLVTYYDNRTKQVKDEMDRMLRNGEYKLFRGPVVKDWPAPGDEIKPMLFYYSKGVSDDKDVENQDGTTHGASVIGVTRPAPQRGQSLGQPQSKKGKLVDVSDDDDDSGSDSQKRALHAARVVAPPPPPPLFAVPRSNIIGAMQNDTAHANDPTELARMEYDDLAYAYTATRNNVSALAWPVLQDLMASCDSLLIHDMALAIWAQLTAAPVAVAGPYHFGLTRFTSLEQRVAADPAFDDAADRAEARYVIQTLRETYQQAWTNATAAANRFGGLDLMARIAERLTPADASIVPPEDLAPDLTAVNIFGAFQPPPHRFVTSAQYAQMWADAGFPNGTTAAGNGTTAAGNGTMSGGFKITNNTWMGRFRRPFLLPAHA